VVFRQYFFSIYVFIPFKRYPAKIEHGANAKHGMFFLLNVEQISLAFQLYTSQPFAFKPQGAPSHPLLHNLIGCRPVPTNRILEDQAKTKRLLHPDAKACRVLPLETSLSFGSHKSSERVKSLCGVKGEVEE